MQLKSNTPALQQKTKSRLQIREEEKIKKKKKAEAKLQKTKKERIEEGLGIWTSFYRANPHRLAIDYFGIRWLKPFQQVLICLILKFTYCMIIASRGMGKTLLVAVAICIKAVLYPKSLIVITAGNRGQSVNVLNKIVNELMPASLNLRNEIAEYSTAPTVATIRFKNGSTVKVATAKDSSRSERATWIINDEFVRIKKNIIDGVIRKFKAGQRTPGFHNNPMYKNYPKEPNCETYISSAHYKSHYSWEKFLSFFKSMAKGGYYSVVGLPYQLPVSEGYYPLQQAYDEMQEADFDSVAWQMEMESLFFGEAEDAFYSFNDITVNRIIYPVIYPRPLYTLVGKNNRMSYKLKENGEIRIIGMDIATQGGEHNDNTCYSVLQLVPTSNHQYTRNLMYMQTLNGGNTFDQAIRLRQLYDDCDADYVVVDTLGVGIGVFDNLVREIVDEDRGLVYSPWSCVNDPEMAKKCKDKTAPKVIYSIKANPQFNNDAAVFLRDHLRRGKVRLPINDIDADEDLIKREFFRRLPVEQQNLLQEPYKQTTLLVNEMINLSFEIVGGKIKVIEPPGKRKDRYSSLSYANIIANDLEQKLIKPHSGVDYIEYLSFKAPVKVNDRSRSLYTKNKRRW